MCVHRCACGAALGRFEPCLEGWRCLGAAPRKHSTEDGAPYALSGPSASVAEWDFPRDALIPHCYLSVPPGKAGAPKGRAEEMLVQSLGMITIVENPSENDII